MKTSHKFLSIIGIIMFFVIAGIFFFWGEIKLYEDNARAFGNMNILYSRLESYNMAYGKYPPQQDMKSLLKTLGLNKSDFSKVLFFDISSAEYLAPSLNPEDPLQNLDDPVLSLCVKSHVFGKYQRLCLRKDGSMYFSDYETGAKL